MTENGTPRAVAYDSAGNETTVGTANYAYSPRNLLASGDALSYLYDGGGIRRVTTTSTGSRFSFASPEFMTMSESAVTSSGKPAIAYDYVWFGDRPVAQIDASGTHYTFADHLGTPDLQMDGSANVSWQAEYEPYGKVWALRAQDVHQPLRLPGQVAEQFDTGANGASERSYNVFRWYRSGWGRYSQRDPIELSGGSSLYGYVVDNPIDVADPLGLRIRVYERYAGLSSGVSANFFGPYYHTIILLEPDDPRAFGFSRCYIEALNSGPTWDFWKNHLNKHSYRELQLPYGTPYVDLTPAGPTNDPTINDTIAISQILSYYTQFPNDTLWYSYLQALNQPFGYNSGSFTAGALDQIMVIDPYTGQSVEGSRALKALPGFRPGDYYPYLFNVDRNKGFAKCGCQGR